MASNIPKEYQKSYTWDAIVFNDGATCVRIDDDDATRATTTTRRTDPTTTRGTLRVSRTMPNRGASSVPRPVSGAPFSVNEWVKMMTDENRRVFRPATQVRGLGERARTV
jgi:hypothetical protein